MAELTPPPVSAKFVIAGGFGVGKTTFVGAVSEIPPLRTEAAMTEASVGFDDISQVQTKTTTTVAMDFGRITVEQGLVLYLFGTPGQDRFGFMWQDIVDGALGALVLVDTRRLDDCYPAIDYFESRDIPFVVVMNHFEGAPRHRVADVRYVLNIPEHVPMISVDARSTESVKAALLALLEHLLEILANGGQRPEKTSVASAPMPPPAPTPAPPPPAPPEPELTEHGRPKPAPAKISKAAADRALAAIERTSGSVDNAGPSVQSMT